MCSLKTAALALAALALAACAPLPQRAGVPTRWVPSPSFDLRRANYVILHHTSNDSAQEALETLTDRSQAVSAHYLVSREGIIYQLVGEQARAWHAGKSRWGADSDLNSSSIGIELDNNGEETYPAPQIDALLFLLRDIVERHRIPAGNILGHADVAPARKVDPSAHFPWRTLALSGFGLWCEPPFPALPAGFDADMALQAVGYDMSDPEAARSAFRLHFLPGDAVPPTEYEHGLLYCLSLRQRIGAP